MPTTDGLGSLITPEYSRTAADIYRALAFTMLHSSKKPLAFLAHGVHRGSLEHASTATDHCATTSKAPAPLLPSWIPEWHAPRPQTLTPLQPHPEFAAGLSGPSLFLDVKETEVCGPLAVRGFKIGIVECTHKSCFAQPWFNHDEHQDLAELLARNRHTKGGLEVLAMNLAGGKTWYGVPIDNRSTMLSDFACCLITGRLLWALRSDAFGTSGPYGGVTLEARGEPRGSYDSSATATPDSIVTVNDLEEWYKNGRAGQFLQAARSACIGKCLFTTTSGACGVLVRLLRRLGTGCV